MQLQAGDFLPDIDADGLVADSASGLEPGDDWDRRSADEIDGRYHTGRGYRVTAVENFTRGSNYTDLTISSSYTVSAGMGFDPVLTGELARTFGAFPTADTDSDTGSNLPGEDNNLPFIFDFYVDSLAINPANPLYVAIAHGDLDETQLEFNLKTANNLTATAPFVTTGVSGDGEIHSSYAIIDGTTLSFNDVFTWDAANAQWHGYLEVTLSVVAGQTEDTYFAIDFVELTTSLRNIGVIRVPEDYATVQEAINAALDGNTVFVAPGTYFENLNMLGKNITLRSLDPLDPATVAATILDGGNSGPVIAFHGGETKAAVRGFTIRNGNGTFGGGISGNGTVAVIENNVITDNTAIFGGGIFMVRGLVVNNDIASNTATDVGGGVYDAHELWRNHIHDNSAVNAGGGVWSSATQIVNNLISGNSVTDLNASPVPGAGLHKQSYGPDSLVAHNTFVDNTWNGTVVNVIDETGALPLRNNILWDSSGASPSDWDRLQSSDLLFNLVTGAPAKGTDARFNLGDDPLLTDPVNGDFTLQSASPAVDAGGALLPPVPIDYDGALREFVSPDIGAYESAHSAATQDYVYLEIVSDGTGGTPLILNAWLSASLQALIDGGATITWQWTLNGVNIQGATSSTLTVNPFTAADAGDYQAIATIDGQPHTLTTYTVPGPILALDSETCSDNVVLDPSFENASLGVWSGDIENILYYDPFTFPNTAPVTGDYFLWLGDFATPTIASIKQSVVVPATGNATLEFYLFTEQASAAYGATDQLDVTMDGVSVLAGGAIFSDDANYHNSYGIVRIDVSAYADGREHVLMFETIQTGSTVAADVTNFVIDDVSISTGTDCADNWGIDIAPGFLHFGRVANSASKQLTVSVINTGGAPLVGSIQVIQPFGSTTLPYSIVENPPDYNIPQGGSATFTVDFTPLDNIERPAHLVFSGGGGFTIPLVGFTTPAVPYTNTAERVIINEIQTVNSGNLLDGEGELFPWIEVANLNAFPISLDGWKLQHTPSSGIPDADWSLPSVDIPPFGTVFVLASGKVNPGLDSGLHAPFQLDPSGGVELKLVRPDPVNPNTEIDPLYLPSSGSGISENFYRATSTYSDSGINLGNAVLAAAVFAQSDESPGQTNNELPSIQKHTWRLTFQASSQLKVSRPWWHVFDTTIDYKLIRGWLNNIEGRLLDDADGDSKFEDVSANVKFEIRNQPDGNWILGTYTGNHDLETPFHLKAAHESTNQDVLFLKTFIAINPQNPQEDISAWGHTSISSLDELNYPEAWALSEHYTFLYDETIHWRNVILFVHDETHTVEWDTVLAHELGHYSGMIGHPFPQQSVHESDRIVSGGLFLRDRADRVTLLDRDMYLGRWDFPWRDPQFGLVFIPHPFDRDDSTPGF